LPGRVEGDVEWPLRDEIAYNAEMFEPGPCTWTVEFFFAQKGTVTIGRTFDRRESRRREIKGKIGAGVFTIKEGVDMDPMKLLMVVMVLWGWLWLVPAMAIPPRSRTRGWI